MMIAALVGAWAAAMTIAIWACRQMPERLDLTSLAALAALTAHAYSVLAIEVHENHLFYAVPFLVIVAAARPRYRRLFAATSAVLALNVYFFYGFGYRGAYVLSRNMTGVDITVILAACNCALLVWHALLFRQEVRTSPVRTGVEPGRGAPYGGIELAAGARLDAISSGTPA
jgi:hypothetical protein